MAHNRITFETTRFNWKKKGKKKTKQNGVGEIVLARNFILYKGAVDGESEAARAYL